MNLRENERITIGTIPLRNLEMYHSPPPPDTMPTPSAPPMINEPQPLRNAGKLFLTKGNFAVVVLVWFD